MVAVIRYAVVAHAWWFRPLRSSAMVRIAVATMVWSSAARNMPIISPMRMVTIWRWVSGPVGRSGSPRAVVGDPGPDAVDVAAAGGDAVAAAGPAGGME